MHQHRLAFERLHQRRVDRVHQPGGHRAVHLQVGGGDRLAVFGVGDDDPADPFAEVGEVGRHRQDRHHLGGDGDVEARLGLKPVQLATTANLDVPQRLRAEVDRPTHLDPRGINVEPLQPAFRQPGVIVVALMLHAGVERDHRQIVRVGDGVDIAGQPQGEGRQRNHLRQAAARGGSFDVEGRTAARLPDGSDHAFAQLSKPFDEAQRGGGLSFAQRGGGDRRDIDILGAVCVGTEPAMDRTRIHFRERTAVGHPFAVAKSEFIG